MTRTIDRAAIVVATLLLALAGVIFWDMSRLEISSTYGLGPKAMPVVVATGLVLLAVGHLVLAWTPARDDIVASGAIDLPEREAPDPKALVLILSGLAALIALIGLGGGFIPATAILFATTAAAFGRRAFHIDLLVGLVLGTVAYLLFDKLLTLSLPAGPLERLL